MKTGNISSFQYFKDYISTDQVRRVSRIGGQILISSRNVGRTIAEAQGPLL